MGFSSLRLKDFRNFKNSEIIFDSSEVFFIGENGQGKTNIIEALYLLCYGSSFRVRYDRLLINNNNNNAFIEGHFKDKNNPDRKIVMKISRNTAKEIIVDDKKVKDRKELIQNIPCVVFSHNDIQIVIGAPYLRRKFFNQTLCMYDILFVDLLRKYKAIILSRNQILKENRMDLLDVYNLKLAQYGLEIQQKRERIINIFNTIFTELFQKITGLKNRLSIHYESSWKNCNQIQEIIHLLKNNIDKDIFWKTTITGPHRDRFLFYLDGKDFLKVASTGQIRLISIILKIAQAQFYSSLIQKAPLLLLDDVLLEIDRKRREALINFLPSYEQAFFTFLPDEDFTSYEKDGTLKYLINNGELKRWKKPGTF